MLAVAILKITVRNEVTVMVYRQRSTGQFSLMTDFNIHEGLKSFFLLKFKITNPKANSVPKLSFH
jgi:hypothetical protein